MPKFLDYHATLPPMPPEAMQMMQDRIKGGQADEFGCVALNIYMSTTGQAWCLSEGPNADAVCQSHVAKGILLEKGDVHQVNSVA